MNVNSCRPRRPRLPRRRRRRRRPRRRRRRRRRRRISSNQVCELHSSINNNQSYKISYLTMGVFR
jgi:hypothetical protein